jgi:hypothetical protein
MKLGKMQIPAFGFFMVLLNEHNVFLQENPLTPLNPLTITLAPHVDGHIQA